MRNQAQSTRDGHYLTGHFADIYKKPEPQRTGKEILNDLVERGALEVVNGII